MILYKVGNFKSPLIICLLSMFLVMGCATPPEVKQLSIKQTEYFDVVIKAVSIQSDALIIATEKLIQNAIVNIDLEERNSKKEFNDTLLSGRLTKDQANDIIERISQKSKLIKQSKDGLTNDLNMIKNKIAEIKLFLTKMKEVNTTMDAYIQSEKAGETVVKDILNQPNVKALLATVSDLTPKIMSGVDELNDFITNINGEFTHE
ncbi:hypothetical protein H4J58_09470 [Colwellia sp. MB3u-70]|uniref:hypothetical protein n=1 Tax=unclassified Colwellia TaxID=196834 RepID=UPI0015F581D6|nr:MULTISPECIES: hypothetical protein [unclassified Colwellia]MBA6291243.1 hypothetical protein [Colwellia sp. MB3u-8]MBA6307341.1 hypothetical protein [Colwellia sp. MB3u-70]MBA6342608.1 hypothetical protein [Colwellia sp. MB02u-10]